MGDRYTISERLDQEGGMAEVFIGVAESLQGFKKNVAIKRILPNLTKNDKFVAMFLDEAKLSLHLQHANIVQVFDIGVTDSTYFLVMEYVNGCNLKGLIEYLAARDRQMSTAQAIYIVLECCKALSYAHHVESSDGEPLNIVHRDVSPPNILLSRMGEVKLVDFGLAKASSQIETTDPGIVKGKFSYLSPEAAHGAIVDARTDIFAIGIILWELFTGKRLFFGETDYQTVQLVRQAKIPSISAINPQIDQELEAIVLCALARDPDKRYQTSADLSDALAQYLFGHRMKVTARDIAALVQETQKERLRKQPQQSLIDTLIQEEMSKITSLRDDGSVVTVEESDGGQILDPRSFINTAAWTQDFGLNSHTQGGDISHGHDSGNEIESLQQMLEPDRTSGNIPTRVKKTETKGASIAIFIALFLAIVVGTGVFLFKDRLVGKITNTTDASVADDPVPAPTTK